MQALTVTPGHAETLALHDVLEPTPRPGELLVDGVAIGVWHRPGNRGRRLRLVPPGEERLIIGHESLGRVRQAAAGSVFTPGELVVGVVRRPGPAWRVARGHCDMGRNGRYTERGIKELHGYGSQRWCVQEEYAVKLDERLAQVGVLMEPTTVVAKAWEEIEKVGHRSWFDPQSVLVTGAGPIGLLAAMLGVQRGLDVHVLDQVTNGPKPDLVSDLGATYHHGDFDAAAAITRPDVVLEATGVGSLVFAAMRATTSYGVVCLTGVSPRGRAITVDAGSVNREIVLENDVVIGSVNANLSHYRSASTSLAQADLTWLDRLISRRVPLSSFEDAFTPQKDDVKVVITLGPAES